MDLIVRILQSRVMKDSCHEEGGWVARALNAISAFASKVPLSASRQRAVS
jgi:hypothetical protein